MENFKLEDGMMMASKLEDKFLCACMHYPKLVGMSMDKLDEESFSSSVKGNLYAALVKFYNIFDKTVPAHDELVLTLEELYTEGAVGMIVKYLGVLKNVPCPEWEWILHHADKFIKKIDLGAAMHKAAMLNKGDNYDEAQEILLHSIRKNGLISGGMADVLQSDSEYLSSIGERENTKCCDTRIYTLDPIIGGLNRKEALMVLAPLNVGKSWAMLHFAVSALMEGKYVLYETFEMPRERVLGRILQNICGATAASDSLTSEIEGWNSQFTDKEILVAPTIKDVAVTKKHLNHLARFGGKLAIQEYSSGTPTMRDVERDLGLFDATFNRTPDLVIIDGLGDMRLTGKLEPRKELGNIVKDMRKLAKDYHAAVVFTHQGNRESMKADIVEAHHTSESLPIIQVTDTALSLTQTNDEYERGEMRLMVMRARNSKKYAYMKLYQNLDIGQFCLHSEHLPLPQGR